MTSKDYIKIRKAAFRYRRAGLSVIPISTRGTKAPYAALLPRDKRGKASWSLFQTTRPTAEQTEAMFPGNVPMGIGIVGGAVSGGLEIIDIDDHDSWLAFRELVEEKNPGLLQRIPQVQSPRPGGGRHLYVFSDSPGPCCTLAADEDGTKLIEIKAEAGYCLAPGSHPNCHPSRREYQHVDGTPDIEQRPHVSDAERSLLFACANALNRYVQECQQENGEHQELTAGPDAPGNIFMRKETFESAGLLQKHGWTVLGRHADRIAWARPDREDKPGFSALSGPDRYGNDRLVVFSTKAGPFQEQRSYNLFQAFALLECKGDYRRAALRLVEKGYASAVKKSVESHTLLHAPLKWQPVPLDALPDPVGAYVRNVASALNADPGFLIGPILAELAAAIGNSRRLQLKIGWNEPSVVWAAFLATSGTMKSPAMDHSKRHLEKIHREAARDFRIAQEEFEQQCQTYEESLRQWRKDRSQSEMPTRPTPPVPVSYLVDNITIEAAVERLQQNPRGLLLAVDELAGWITSFNQYRGGKGADVQHWLSMHGARSVKYDRKGQNPVFIAHAAVSVAGPVPPETFKQVVGRQHYDDGLVPRLLVVMPPERAKKWTDKDICAKLDRRMESLVRRLVDLSMEEDEHGDPVPQLVRLDDTAHALWRRWYDHHGLRQAQASGLLKPALAKLEAYCARFALIFHLIRYVENDAEDLVDQPTVRMAIDLTEWFVHEAQRVYAKLHVNEDNEELLEFVEWWKGRTEKLLTPRKVANSGPRKYRNDTQTATKLLNRLVSAGWAKRSVHRKKRGAPATKYELVEYANSPFSENTALCNPHPQERCADSLEEIEMVFRRKSEES